MLQILMLATLTLQPPANIPPDVHCDDSSSFAQIRQMFPSRPIVVGKALLRPNTPASPGARIECTLDVGERELVFYQREAGQLDGLSYRISYLDGKGMLGEGTDKWFISCNIDPIEDTRTCILLRRSLMIVAMAGSPEIVRIGENHVPGSESAIRLDKGTPFRSRTDGFFGESKKILAGLETCGQAILRYREWPSEAPKDETLSCAGFRQARALLQWALKSIPAP